MKKVFNFSSVLLLILFFMAQLSFGQSCITTFVPDLPLIPSNSTIQNEINTIYQYSSDQILGTSAPSAAAVNTAITSYNNLNITVSGSTITGVAVSNFNAVSFISTFAQYLKFNPTDSLMKIRVRNTIWWVAQNLCNGTLAKDNAGYTFRNFARGAVFCADYLDAPYKEKFLYIIENNSSSFNQFWTPSYDSLSQKTNGVINTDFIYNNIDVMVSLVRWFSDAEQQYRYMLTLTRYITRFVSTYTIGTNDGMKPDGCGYHHWNNYEAYMYAYNTLVVAMKFIGKSSFQIKSPAYLKFRDAVMHKELLCNDGDVVPLCMTGRSGDWDAITFSQTSLSTLAILGGAILGLPTADTVLAGIYNRKYGINSTFNYSTVAPFETGFYQVNHANAGIFRNNGCVIVSKGFNNQLWGSEGYPSENRYGRYQSYGALAIVYSGTKTDNGFVKTKWDWNYNPGATTKVLPWDKLIAGWSRLDEYSSERFAGSLVFNLKNAPYLNAVFGNYGMSAMSFKEKVNLGFGTVTATDTHDASFVFKKSTFFFKDIIICLGSDISNVDANYPTVTTLYQNVTTPQNVIINNGAYSTTDVTTSFSGTSNNWVLDNFGTGFYISSGSGDLKAKRSNQQTPSPNQTNPTILNTAAQAAIGYIDHGKLPNKKTYEYVVVPRTTSTAMSNLALAMQDSITKPYTVLNKTSNYHI